MLIDSHPIADTVNTVTRALEEASASAPARSFARYSDTVLRDPGMDDQVLRAAPATAETR